MVIVVPMKVVSFPMHEIDPVFLLLLEVSVELAF
jgi:hypothetical protein